MHLTTGVYFDWNRRSALVVRVNKGKVVYLTLDNGTVQLNTSSVDRFVHRFIISQPNYPIHRAAKVYADNCLDIDPDVKKVLRLVLANTKGAGV